MSVAKLIACAAAGFLAGGCSSALGPDASIRVPAEARAPGSAVNLYWPCLVDVPTPDLLKDRYRVEVDGKDVGEMARCGYARFDVPAGRHAIRLRSPLVLDIAGMMGIKGIEYTIPAGRPIYIRLTYFQYVEYQQVASDEGIRDIERMTKE